MNNNQKKEDPNKKKNIKSALILLVICIGLTGLFTTVMNRYKNGSQTKITYDRFVEMLEKKEVKKVVLSDSRITIEPKKQTNPLMKNMYYVVGISDDKLVDRLLASDVSFLSKDKIGRAHV